MSEFLTTRDVARKYGVSEYTVTQKWVPDGLKHFPSCPFRYKLEWVEEFIEEQAEKQLLKNQTPICEIKKIPKLKNIPKFHDDMRIRMEDFFPERKSS